LGKVLYITFTLSILFGGEISAENSMSVGVMGVGTAINAMTM
jgi:hypothetical protein